MQYSDRTDLVLREIDKAGAVTINQLRRMIDLGSYRNACRVVQDLKPYLITQRSKEKVIYLNKKGREYINSSATVEGKQLEHAIMMSEIYIYFQKPYTWEREVTFEEQQTTFNEFVVANLKIAKGIEVRADAIFERNGYLHIVEADNTQSMSENREKLDKYRKILPQLRDKNPRIYFFTKSEHRKKQLMEWGKGLPIIVMTLDEIK